MSKSPEEWMPIRTHNGRHQGLYEVSEGMITVRYQGNERSTRASSTGLPPSAGVGADQALAQLLLSEISRRKISVVSACLRRHSRIIATVSLTLTTNVCFSLLRPLPVCRISRFLTCKSPSMKSMGYAVEKSGVRSPLPALRRRRWVDRWHRPDSTPCGLSRSASYGRRTPESCCRRNGSLAPEATFR